MRHLRENSFGREHVAPVTASMSSGAEVARAPASLKSLHGSDDFASDPPVTAAWSNEGCSLARGAHPAQMVERIASNEMAEASIGGASGRMEGRRSGEALGPHLRRPNPVGRKITRARTHVDRYRSGKASKVEGSASPVHRGWDRAADSEVPCEGPARPAGYP